LQKKIRVVQGENAMFLRDNRRRSKRKHDE